MLLLVGQSSPEGVFDATSAFEDRLLDGAPVATCKWLHVGHQCLSPWRVAYHELYGPTVDSASPELAVEADPQATNVFFMARELVDTLDSDLRWCSIVYHVCFTQRLMGSVLLDEASVRLVKDSIRLLWRP